MAKELTSFISELLYDHECIIVPRLGGFLTRYQGASIHPVQHTFTPPTRTVVFNPALLENDGLLINYIARRKRISYDEAAEWVQSEIVAILNGLKHNNEQELPGLGILKRNTEQRLLFIPNDAANFLHDAYGLGTFVSPAIRRESRLQAEKRVIKAQRRAEKTFTGSWHSVIWPAAAAVAVIGVLSWTVYSQFFRTSQYTNDFIPVAQKEEPVNQSNKSTIPEIKTEQASILPTHTDGAEEQKPEVRKPVVKENIVKENTEDKSTYNAESDFSSAAAPVVEEEIIESPVNDYYIICGSYLNKTKARKFYQRLINQGFDAQILGPYENGRVRISCAHYTDQEAAALRLDEIRKIIRKDAWILEEAAN